MNTWEVTWKSYDYHSSRAKIFIETISMVSLGERLWILFIFLLFIISIFAFLAMFLLQATFIEMLGFITSLIASEVLLLLKLESVKKLYIDEHLGGEENSKSPPDNRHQRKTRYMKFSMKLKEKGINAEMLPDIHKALSAKQELEKESNLYVKNYLSFALGLLSGMLLVFSRQMELTHLIFSIIGFGTVSFFAYFLLSMFPSSMEKLKELNYFLILYEQEI
ncbi:MAG: hypothetical protein KBT88_08440 [Gammaproteobacteria bacterium]|nr:hypothetical protein [Gammaproteobacteria bacterium]MBQ0839802.1 hypothetical protein [Gammaproteobacteria bacterium]